MRRRPDRPPFFPGGLRLATLLWAFVFGAFVLGACETSGPGRPGPGAGPEAATPEAGSAESQAPAEFPEDLQADGPGSDPQESTGRESGAEPDPELAAVPGAPTGAQTGAPQIDDDPAQLIGIDPARLDSLLGRPDLVRREPPAEIWQYRGAACIFDVFLYEEAGTQRVTYIEARNQAAEQTPPRPCLNGLLRARLPQPYG